MLREKVESILNKRKKLHPNDPGVEMYWTELANLLGSDERKTISFLRACSEEDIGWISEVFEDISERLNSSLFIECLKELNKKYPDLELEGFMDDAQEYLS